MIASMAIWRKASDMENTFLAARDREVVSAINRRCSAGLRAVGRAPHGRLGGAIYASWPDGRPAVVTRFLGPLAEAKRAAEVLAYVAWSPPR